MLFVPLLICARKPFLLSMAQQKKYNSTCFLKGVSKISILQGMVKYFAKMLANESKHTEAHEYVMNKEFNW